MEKGSTKHKVEIALIQNTADNTQYLASITQQTRHRNKQTTDKVWHTTHNEQYIPFITKHITDNSPHSNHNNQYITLNTKLTIHSIQHTSDKIYN